jgi:hypothetical protein
MKILLKPTWHTSDISLVFILTWSKCMYDLIIEYSEWRLYKIRLRRSFFFFHRRCRLATLSPPREQNSVLKAWLIYTLKRLLSVNRRALVQWTETVGGDRVASLQLRKKAKNDRFLLDSNHPILELTKSCLAMIVAKIGTRVLLYQLAPNR